MLRLLIYLNGECVCSVHMHIYIHTIACTVRICLLYMHSTFIRQIIFSITLQNKKILPNYTMKLHMFLRSEIHYSAMLVLSLS